MTIQATIVMEDHETWTAGKTIEEVLEKIKELHTMSEFEKNHYAQKNRLDAEMSSGWWVKEKNT
jgi:predicted RNase H-like HicB family nuclease